ncbi:hypothetical protein [Clostridium butyricum]|uniref:Uncharacterized protein n=1 Tax=Clostridium butyricum E4 str. BoNT E BL5262 TaxID=632245 RepID=C4IL92_CLOBU|nr:hypothetical protein [Clostridium butyricum]EDT76338.1 hypothetical protein CBY_0615 [Clostridium butyricum 5521]EEP54858.1 conserved hypothetical protein [Clostridium butyricum E4 str. BoNT E BL5262]NFL30708.1 hypothetical protein [Clostridium butyricum]NFS18037.1 hypothetical protein [Clostridium butyricum]
MKVIEHLLSIEEYYEVEKIIGTDFEFRLKNRPRQIYNYIQEYLKDNELLIRELNELDSGKLLGYEKNCAIRVAQQLINGEDKERLETIESTSAQSFRTFSDLDSIIRRKEEALNKKTKHKYDNKHLAQQYIECLKSKDEMPTLEQYEAYMSYRID